MGAATVASSFGTCSGASLNLHAVNAVQWVSDLKNAHVLSGTNNRFHGSVVYGSPT